MRTSRAMVAVAAILALALGGCGATGAAVTGGDSELIPLMLDTAEASAWLISPDDGPVDGASSDCTGAPYTWPSLTTLAHAAQYLDRRDETVSIVLKRLDGPAAANVEALRGALAPCAPVSGKTKLNGAMITPVGDDSFAYQTSGSNDLDTFAFSNLLIACGDLILELSSWSYSNELRQAEIEELVAPVLARMAADQGCPV